MALYCQILWKGNRLPIVFVNCIKHNISGYEFKDKEIFGYSVPTSQYNGSETVNDGVIFDCVISLQMFELEPVGIKR